jgi:cytochrome c biogenesis protein CcdA
MIGQITPLVQAAGYRVWLQAVAAHAAGALLSAAALGLLLGTVGGSPRLPRGGVAVALAVGGVFLACALKEAEVTSCPLPSLRRQTPKRLLCAFGSIWGPFVWGLDLGQGWTTYVDYYGYYALAVWTFVLGSPLAGVAIMGAYGLGRVLPVLVVGLAPGHTAAGPLGTAYLEHHWIVRRVNATALAFTGACIVVASVLR